jgi:hypothetical protein
MAAPSWASAVNYDVAVITLQNNGAGYPVTAYVGNLPYIWVTSGGAALTENEVQIGYPANLLAGDRYTYLCYFESYPEGSWPDVEGYGCDMGGGSSGGPTFWLYFANQPGYISGRNYVDGVRSGEYIGTYNKFGPQFTDANILPLCTAEGC